MAKFRPFDRTKQYQHTRAPKEGFFSTLDELIAVSPKEDMTVQEWREYLQPGRMGEREGMQFPLKKAELDDLDLIHRLDELAKISTDSDKLNRYELLGGVQGSRPQLEEILYADDNPRAKGTPRYADYKLHHDVPAGEYLESVTRERDSNRTANRHFGYDSLFWSRATTHPSAGENPGRVRLVEEIQSDVHQEPKARMRGYQTPQSMREYEQLLAETIEEKAKNPAMNYAGTIGGRDPLIIDRLDRLEALREQAFSGAEDAPFKDPKQYAQVELSKQLLDAVEADDQYLAITRGDDQVKRNRQEGLSAEKGTRHMYDKIYPSVLKSLAKRYGARMVDVPIEVSQPALTPLRVPPEGAEFLQTVGDVFSHSADEFYEADVYGWDIALTDISNVYEGLMDDVEKFYQTDGEKLIPNHALKRVEQRMGSLERAINDAIKPDIDDLVESGYNRNEITEGTIEGIRELRMSEGSATFTDIMKLLPLLEKDLSHIHKKVSEAMGLSQKAVKTFPALEITPEVAERVRTRGLPLYAKGGRIPRKGSLYDDALDAIRGGNISEAFDLLEQLKIELNLDDEGLGRLLSEGHRREGINPETIPDYSLPPDLNTPIGGYAKGGKISRGALVDMVEHFKKKQAESSQFQDDFDLVGLPKAEVSDINEWIPPDERMELSLLGEDPDTQVPRGLLDDFEVESTEYLPPTDEVVEYHRQFMDKVDEGVRQKEEAIKQQNFLFNKGEHGYSIHSGKKFKILGKDLNKDGALMYLVEGPDGAQHQMHEWGLSRKPLEPVDLMKNKESFKEMGYNKWADREAYDEILPLVEDWFDELGHEFDGDLQIVQDLSRPGVYGVMDMESGDQWVVKDGELIETGFDDWPPKKRYAEGGAVGGTGEWNRGATGSWEEDEEGPRPKLNYLRAIAHSLANAIPFISDERREEIGTGLSYLPAGFKTQAYGIDPETDELRFGFRGEAIPGIIDETIALPAMFADSDMSQESMAPDISRTALNRVMDLEDKVLEEEGLDYPKGALQNLMYSGGIMLGQLPVPGNWIKQAKRFLPATKLSPGRILGSGVEFLSPIVEPKIGNYLAGSLFGGAMMTGFDALAESGESDIPPELIELVERAKAGDEEAYKQAMEIYAEYQRQQAADPEVLNQYYDQRLDDMNEESITGQYAKGGRIRSPQYRIWDNRDKKYVGQPYSNKRRVRTRVDKLDNEYGAYRYIVKELVEDSPKEEMAKGGKINRRDLLKGLGALGATVVGAGKASHHADAGAALKAIESKLVDATPIAKSAQLPLHGKPFRDVAEKIRIYAYDLMKDTIDLGKNYHPDDLAADMEEIAVRGRDADQFEELSQLIDEENYQQAAELYDNLDTDARESIYHYLEGDELNEARRILGAIGSEWDHLELSAHPEYDKILEQFETTWKAKDQPGVDRIIKELEKEGYDTEELFDLLEDIDLDHPSKFPSVKSGLRPFNEHPDFKKIHSKLASLKKKRDTFPKRSDEWFDIEDEREALLSLLEDIDYDMDDYY